MQREDLKLKNVYPEVGDILQYNNSYFEINNVLQNGVFYAANKLYGLTFRERHDLPVYQEDVRVFDVIDKDGLQIALFYCDYFKRDNKNGGAWMDNFVD